MNISFGKEKSECFPFNKSFFFTMKTGHFLVCVAHEFLHTPGNQLIHINESNPTHLEFCNKADTVCSIIRMGGMLSCMESDVL